MTHFDYRQSLRSTSSTIAAPRQTAPPVPMPTPPAGIAPRVMSEQAAAAYLGVSRSFLRGLRARGLLKKVRLSRRVLYDTRELDRLIDCSKRRDLAAPPRTMRGLS